MGIRFELNCEVGKDISLETLLESYDAVFVGVGTYRSMKLIYRMKTRRGYMMRCHSSSPIPNR